MTNLNRLKEIREREGMTQSELSVLTGIGITTISKLENHHIAKSHRVIVTAIASIFDCLESDIFPDYFSRGSTL